MQAFEIMMRALEREERRQCGLPVLWFYNGMKPVVSGKVTDNYFKRVNWQRHSNQESRKSPQKSIFHKLLNEGKPIN